MDKKIFDNGDVIFTTEFNFDLDEWVGQFDKKGLQLLLVDCNRYLRHIIKLRFMRGTGPGNIIWPQNSPLTLASGKTGSLMRGKGDLLRSIKSTIVGDEVIISTNKKYAQILSRGAKYKTTPKQSYFLWANVFPDSSKAGPSGPFEITLPARPFFGFDDNDKQNIRDLALKHFKKTERMGTHAI